MQGRIPWLAWPTLASAWLWAHPAAAQSVTVATQGGLMQQPTSQYYHLIYGLALTLANTAESSSARLSYVERPLFQALGFADQERAWSLQVGSKLTRAKNHGLYAYLGGGRLHGFVRAKSDAARAIASVGERSFTLGAVTATVEYLYLWRHLALAINHQTFVGFADDEQTQARVAWPYNFFQTSLGYRW